MLPVVALLQKLTARHYTLTTPLPLLTSCINVTTNSSIVSKRRSMSSETNPKCIFCKIVAKTAPATILAEVNMLPIVPNSSNVLISEWKVCCLHWQKPCSQASLLSYSKGKPLSLLWSEQHLRWQLAYGSWAEQRFGVVWMEKVVYSTDVCFRFA